MDGETKTDGLFSIKICDGSCPANYTSLIMITAFSCDRQQYFQRRLLRFHASDRPDQHCLSTSVIYIATTPTHHALPVCGVSLTSCTS